MDYLREKELSFARKLHRVARLSIGTSTGFRGEKVFFPFVRESCQTNTTECSLLFNLNKRIQLALKYNTVLTYKLTLWLVYEYKDEIS